MLSSKKRLASIGFYENSQDYGTAGLPKPPPATGLGIFRRIAAFSPAVQIGSCSFYKRFL